MAWRMWGVPLLSTLGRSTRTLLQCQCCMTFALPSIKKWILVRHPFLKSNAIYEQGWVFANSLLCNSRHNPITRDVSIPSRMWSIKINASELGRRPRGANYVYSSLNLSVFFSGDYASEPSTDLMKVTPMGAITQSTKSTHASRAHPLISLLLQSILNLS